jgi:hypothetical protein
MTTGRSEARTYQSAVFCGECESRRPEAIGWAASCMTVLLTAMSRRDGEGQGEPPYFIQQTQRYLNVTDEELRRGLEVSWNNKGRPLRLASGA